MTTRTPSQMVSIDLRVLSAALGFAVVAMQGDAGTKEGAFRACGFARLIEEFCCSSVPEAFTDITLTNKFAVAERMAAVITAIYRKNGGCLPQDLSAEGFEEEEVDRFWTVANALAHVKLNIMDS